MMSKYNTWLTKQTITCCCNHRYKLTCAPDVMGWDSGDACIDYFHATTYNVGGEL